jgi:hypothetical protein
MAAAAKFYLNLGGKPLMRFLQKGCVAKGVEVLRLTGWSAGLQPSQAPHPQAEAALLQLCKDFVATSAPTVLVCQ